MPYLTEQAVWELNVKEIQLDDDVLGDETGPPNIQARHLANRTQYLKQQLTTQAGLIGSNTSAIGSVSGRVTTLENAAPSMATKSEVSAVEAIANAKALATRTISSGTGLTGGGDLTADRTISTVFSSTSENKTGSITNKSVHPAGLKAYAVRLLDENLSIAVGTGGDYAKLSQALAVLSRMRPVALPDAVEVSSYPWPNTYRAFVTLAADFVLDEQIAVFGQDFSWVTISPAISTTITIDYTGLEKYRQISNGTTRAFHAGFRGVLPLLNTIFVMASGAPANTYGVTCDMGGQAYFTDSGGMRQCSGYNIHAFRGGIIRGEGGSFILGGTGCTRADRGGMLFLQNANCRVTVGSNSAQDITVGNGGYAWAHSAIGGLSQTANVHTASGIIYA
jgi:hypothetical protein